MDIIVSFLLNAHLNLWLNNKGFYFFNSLILKVVETFGIPIAGLAGVKNHGAITNTRHFSGHKMSLQSGNKNFALHVFPILIDVVYWCMIDSLKKIVVMLTRTSSEKVIS